MHTSNNLRPSDVEDFVAPLMTLEIIEGEVYVLEHRAHCTVGDNYATVQGIAETAHVNLSQVNSESSNRT